VGEEGKRKGKYGPGGWNEVVTDQASVSGLFLKSFGPSVLVKGYEESKVRWDWLLKAGLFFTGMETITKQV